MSSNADETAEITLGGNTFTVNAFTLDQLQQLGTALDTINKNPGLAQQVPALKEVIALATGKTVAEIGQLKTNFGELYDAIQVVAKITGLQDLKNRLSPANKPGA